MAHFYLDMKHVAGTKPSAYIERQPEAAMRQGWITCLDMQRNMDMLPDKSLDRGADTTQHPHKLSSKTFTDGGFSHAAFHALRWSSNAFPGCLHYS